jgi:hypothetical protein
MVCHYGIQMLIGTIMTMFSIEIIEEIKGGNNEGTNDYVNFEQWRIKVESIVALVKDQGSFPQQCYEKLESWKLLIKNLSLRRLTCL